MLNTLEQDVKTVQVLVQNMLILLFRLCVRAAFGLHTYTSNRRVWSIVCHTLPLTKSALDTLLVAVCGEDSVPSPAGGENRRKGFVLFLSVSRRRNFLSVTAPNAANQGEV